MYQQHPGAGHVPRGGGGGGRGRGGVIPEKVKKAVVPMVHDLDFMPSYPSSDPSEWNMPNGELGAAAVAKIVKMFKNGWKAPPPNTNDPRNVTPVLIPTDLQKYKDGETYYSEIVNSGIIGEMIKGTEFNPADAWTTALALVPVFRQLYTNEALMRQVHDEAPKIKRGCPRAGGIEEVRRVYCDGHLPETRLRCTWRCRALLRATTGGAPAATPTRIRPKASSPLKTRRRRLWRWCLGARPRTACPSRSP
jgi:hypothetical protein